MAQANSYFFKTAEDIRKETLERLKLRGLNLWRHSAPEYQGLYKKYEVLLEDKKQRGIRPLGRLKRDVEESYPSIPFLDLRTEEEASEVIEEWASQGIAYLNKQLDTVEDAFKANVSINSIRAWIRDYTYCVSRLEYKKRKKAAMKSSAVSL